MTVRDMRWRWYDRLGLAVLVLTALILIVMSVLPARGVCAVRGSLSGVYYLPDDPYYGLTRYRCFADVQSAEAAGFRRGQ